MMPAKPPRKLLDKIIRAVRNDPKKAGILTVLVAILVVLQVRLQMSRSGNDAIARATAGINTASGNSYATGATGTGSNGRPLDGPGALRAWMDAPPAPLGRNLFVVDLERFPRDRGKSVSVSSGNQGFWDELAKSMSSRADVRKERQILVENLTLQASQLRLQSTLMGASPKAVIDGEMVGEGDVVACGAGKDRTQFRVLKIEPRRIIVEREGIKLEIQMK
jgi:hypothetical protein